MQVFSRTPCKSVKVVNVTADVSVGDELVDAIKSACEKYAVSALVYSAGFSMAAPIEYAYGGIVRNKKVVNNFRNRRSRHTPLLHVGERGNRTVNLTA